MPDADVFFNFLKIAGLFVGLSFIVFWVGLVWWVSQDILTRTSDKIIVAAAVAMTAILGPVGVMFYLIIRPKQTLKESYGEMMEHEMMLRAAASTICPMCEHMTQEDFVNCPYCGTVLKKQCAECEKLVAMEWGYCPYCGTVANNHKAAAIPARMEPAAISELAQAREVESLKQDAVKQVRVQRSQESSFTTMDGARGAFGADRLVQASQSAMSLIRQAFGPSTAQDSASVDSHPQPTLSDSSDQDKNQGEAQPSEEKMPSAETDSKVTKKRPTSKKRATKRTKKS